MKEKLVEFNGVKVLLTTAHEFHEVQYDGAVDVVVSVDGNSIAEVLMDAEAHILPVKNILQ
jgi:hypothetical protein